MDPVQAKRASPAASIGVSAIRSLTENTERLSVIQNDVSVIRNDAGQKRLQGRDATAMRTIAVGEDDRPQAARAVPSYQRLSSSRIVVGKRPQPYAARRCAFRAPASDWIAPLSTYSLTP